MPRMDSICERVVCCFLPLFLHEAEINESIIIVWVRYRDSTGCVLLMAAEVGGIFICAGTWITQQPVGRYWSSLCWQGRNEGMGGATRAVEWLHAYCALQNSVGAHSGDGHTPVDVVVELAGISAELPV